MPSKDIKNPPGLRRPPLNPKGGRKGSDAKGKVEPALREAQGGITQDDPAWNWFIRIFIILMVIGVGVVINNAYQYYKRPFVTYTVERGDIITAVFAKGQVEPQHMDKIISRLPDIAVVNKVNVKEGDVVGHGDLLIEISDKILLSRILSADNLVRYQEMTYKGALRYLEQRYATESDVAIQKQKLDNAKERLNFYLSFLDEAKVYAKRSGIVLRRNVEPEDVIKPGQELMWVGEPSPRWVNITVDKEQGEKIELGDEARLYFGYKLLPRMHDYDALGTVSEIVAPQKIDELRFLDDDQYHIYIELSGDVRPQPPSLMPAQAEIRNHSLKDVPWIQYRSIYKGTYLLVKDKDGKVSAHYVELGDIGHTGNRVEVIRGVEPGDTVLLFPEDYVSRFGDVDLPPAR